MHRVNASKVTFCTGYWHVGDNKKHTLDHYLKYIPQTIKLIGGSKLIVFYDDESILELFKENAGKHRVRIEGVKIQATELPAYQFSKRLLNCCKAMKIDEYLSNYPNPDKEKGVNHYQREYLASGEDSYRKVIGIWMSKIFLVARQASSIDAADSEYFAWIDASVSRFSHLRKNWNFMRLAYKKSTMYHYGNEMQYLGRPMAINASFLCAHRDVWDRVGKLFEQYMRASLDDSYAHDEETILNLLLQDNRGLFTQVGSNYRGIRRKLAREWIRALGLIQGS